MRATLAYLPTSGKIQICVGIGPNEVVTASGRTVTSALLAAYKEMVRRHPDLEGRPIVVGLPLE
jgi:hypothetical protein